jgi:hypothetical protein
MNATDLLANTLSAGMPLFLRVNTCTPLNFFCSCSQDANTRQDATQKLETAARDSYVRMPYNPFLRC